MSRMNFFIALIGVSSVGGYTCQMTPPWKGIMTVKSKIHFALRNESTLAETKRIVRDRIQRANKIMKEQLAYQMDVKEEDMLFPLRRNGKIVTCDLLSRWGGAARLCNEIAHNLEPGYYYQIVTDCKLYAPSGWEAGGRACVYDNPDGSRIRASVLIVTNSEHGAMTLAHEMSHTFGFHHKDGGWMAYYKCNYPYTNMDNCEMHCNAVQNAWKHIKDHLNRDEGFELTQQSPNPVSQRPNAQPQGVPTTECEIVVIGSSSSNSKTVTIKQPRNNMKCVPNEHHPNDHFTSSISGSELTVQRTNGNGGGWGDSATNFKCCGGDADQHKTRFRNAGKDVSIRA